jgi:hypothetical protein
MANEEHLKILKQGVRDWNKWRVEHPNDLPDLRGADLSSTRLRGARLRGADLSSAHLSSADLRNADLRSADLIDADLLRADLSRTDLRDAHLRGANLTGANLIGTHLSSADLSDAHLSDAHLRGADLRGANLRGAHLIRARLRGADLSEASLSGAHLRDADLRSADLSDAHLGEAIIGWTVFGGTDLSVAKGLESVVHIGPSTVDIDTLYKSKANIPESFLRGCGVPDDFITYSRSLVGKAIEFYSCFISYSSKNHDFAERLYADLQTKGVRCWYAPEDLKIGDKFRQRIDESIRLHDKLLLILSGQSITSAWVEEEVESAVEREHREKRLVLFPVRIDDTVMESSQAWAASLRRMRHIGDFTDWKDHDSYQRALARLLRDLKADPSTPAA